MYHCKTLLLTLYWNKLNQSLYTHFGKLSAEKKENKSELKVVTGYYIAKSFLFCILRMQVLDNETFIYLSNIEFYCGFTLLHSVPVGRMIVLDLYAEVKPLWINSDQLYGVPYIWQVPFLNIKKQYYFASFFHY
jgi:hypothetical protein